jgi:hypothetical protein
MNSEALMTPARTSSTVSAIDTLFTVLARASRFTQQSFIPRVIEDGKRLIIKGVHLMK